MSAITTCKAESKPKYCTKNVPQITKAVTLLTKASGLFLKPVDKQILETHSGNFVDNFYTSFINPSNRYDYTQDNQNSLDFNFTKKRCYA